MNPPWRVLDNLKLYFSIIVEVTRTNYPARTRENGPEELYGAFDSAGPTAVGVTTCLTESWLYRTIPSYVCCALQTDVHVENLKLMLAERGLVSLKTSCNMLADGKIHSVLLLL